MTMYPKQLWLAAAAALALHAPAVGWADSIKLAYIAPLSGTFALTFEEGLKQFRAAVEEVNAKGGVLGGRQLEIVPYDNKGTPQETLIVLNRAIDDGSHYILATISSVAITIS